MTDERRDQLIELIRSTLSKELSAHPQRVAELRDAGIDITEDELKELGIKIKED